MKTKILIATIMVITLLVCVFYNTKRPQITPGAFFTQGTATTTGSVPQTPWLSNINANGNNLVSVGSLGVGTVSPSALLHTYGNSSSGIGATFQNANASGFVQNMISAQGGTNLFFYGFGGSFTTTGRYVKSSGLVDSEGSGGLGLAASNASGEIKFYTNGSNERARITSAGNLGIGTTTPSETLTIVSGGTDGLSLRYSAISSKWIFYTSYNDTISDFIGLKNSATSNIVPLVIGQSGNIGMGTSTPTSRLQVTAPTANATTTITIGKTGQNKGSCLELFDTAGTAVYASVAAGATSFTLSATSCK